MPLPIPDPLLAAAVLQTVLPIAIFLVSIIVWIVNLVNEKNRQNPRGAAAKPRPRQQDDRFQNEIDMFLNEVQGKPRQEEVPIEIVPDDEIRERQQQEFSAGAVGALASGRSLRDRHLESGVGSHVDQYMDSGNVGEFVETSIGGDFGSMSARSARKRPTTQLKASAARNVVKWLQNPDDVRKAIIVGEILAPCRSLPARR